MNHNCTLEKKKNKQLSTLKHKRLHFIQVSEKNPWTRSYFRSIESIEKERTRIASLKLTNIIHPFSIFRLYWGIAICILHYISLYMIPIRVAFGESIMLGFFTSELSERIEMCEYFFDFFNLADLVINFLTGYHVPNKNFVEMHPHEIAKHNFRGFKTYIDFICGFPMQGLIWAGQKLYPNTSSFVRVVKFCSLIKVLRIYTISLYFKETTALMRYHTVLRHSLRYLFTLSILLHWLTCIYIICLMVIEKDANLQDYQLFVVDKWESILIFDYSTIYWNSMYVVVSYLLNIILATGTREVTRPTYRRLEEDLIFILYSIFGYVYISYLFVCIYQMMNVINSSKIKYHGIKAQLIKYLSYKHLPPNMKQRILSYYEFRYRKKYFRESLILNMLSETIRRDINLYSCRALVESVSVLRELPPDTIGDVVSHLKREVFLYNDIILKAGTSGDSMYFIARGTVAVTTLTGKEICHLQDGAYFGEIAMFSQEQKRVANVIAIEICEVYRLDRKHFNLCFTEKSASLRNMQRIAKERRYKTKLLEELHKKYIVEKITKHIAGADKKQPIKSSKSIKSIK